MIRLRGGPFDGQARRCSDVHLGRLCVRRIVAEEEDPHNPEVVVRSYETVVYELRRERLPLYSSPFAARSEWLEYVGVEP